MAHIKMVRLVPICRTPMSDKYNLICPYHTFLDDWLWEDDDPCPDDSVMCRSFKYVECLEEKDLKRFSAYKAWSKNNATYGCGILETQRDTYECEYLEVDGKVIFDSKDIDRVSEISKAFMTLGEVDA